MSESATPAPGEQVYVQANLSTGLETHPVEDPSSPALRVSWIHWHSGFRGTGLRVGDQIIAVDGTPVTFPSELRELQRLRPTLVGQYQESKRWEERGATEDTPVTLTVRRRRVPGQGWETLEFRGRIRAERVYSSATGRRLIGSGGPDSMAHDGFDFGTSWSAWLEKFQKQGSQVLDDNWQSRSMDSRYTLKEHLASKPRVDFLAERHPGPFAQATREDWEGMRTKLEGRRYELTPADLAYRELGEQRAAQIEQRAREARERFLQSLAKETLADGDLRLNPLLDDRTPVVGKYVVLPVIRNRNWISEAGRNFLTSQIGNTWYFFESRLPAAQRMLLAARRYTKLVSTSLPEHYAVIGRIQPDPRLLIIGDRGVAGFVVEPVAATLGDKAFVDLTIEQQGESPFAGEEELTKTHSALPPDTASPRQVIETMIAAIKAGDQATWTQLFVTWRASALEDGRPLYYPHYPYLLDEPWIHSCRLLSQRVSDVRVVWEGDVRLVAAENPRLGTPRIESVDVQVEHIGLFDGEYHAFTGVAVRPAWELQRLDGGPWRISSVQSL
ncbi:hypothetical protein [Hyalangium rubrum]|uniref:PDZ domain-containing protein n=1 Tax=Hyalangium rubrum TaxID=3103134 RepID=A0ABU5GZQ1_9BACT|nr:hypothetical protein [Hyalangium sp. s54d21]MDY7225325.1 hypothetical protein [Hyalangium sp. s54d21]